MDFSRFFNNFEHIRINKPIFLLGTEAGGLTLVSRILQRHSEVVTVSGNAKQWPSAEEMELVLGPILPRQFTGRRRNKHPELEKLNLYANGIYAADKFLPYYRNTAKDVTGEVKRSFRKILRWIIARNALDKNRARFLDKSQIFTVKLDFLNKILKDTDPKFILITRDPYAMALKFSENARAYIDKKGGKREEALRMAAQHWRNSMECAFGDSREVQNFLWLRFEDILENPEEKTREVCQFVEVDFYKDLLPQPHHRVPFGSKGKHKWYPLREDVNDKYYKKMSPRDVEVIYEVLGEYAEKLGYSKPNVS